MLEQLLLLVASNKLGAFNAVVCTGISFHGVCVINKMRRDSSFVRWLGYALMTCGAFAVAIAPVYGHWSTDASEALMNLGILIAVLRSAYAGWAEKNKGNDND